MAEEKDINIKILIDAAEAAKTVGQTRKALRDLQVAAQSVSEGSDAFNQINKAAGELKDRIGDLQANVKFFADDLRGLTAANEIAQGIAASFGLVTTSLEALGLSTSTAEEATKNLVLVQTALNSLQTIGALIQKESAANIALTNIARAIGINLVVAETTATEGLTFAQKALNLVMKVSPMGVLIGVTTALVAAYSLLTGKTEEQEKAEKKLAEQKKILAEEEKKYTEFIGKESSEYVVLIGRLSETNVGSKERSKLITEINSKYGTTLKNLSDETEFQNQLNKSVDDYINFLKLKYSLQANETLIQANLTKQAKLTKELNKAESDLQKSIQARKDSGYEDTGRDLRIALELQYQVVDDLKKNLSDADSRLKGYVSNSIQATNKIAATGLRTGNETITKGSDKIKEANDKLKVDTGKVIDEILQKEINALEILKNITIELNAQEVKPKSIQQLDELNSKLKDIKDTTSDIIPNIKAFNDAFVIGNQENIGVLDEFGVKFQEVRSKINKLFSDPSLSRNQFVTEIEKIREEFRKFDPDQQKFLNSITENYIKARDILSKDVLYTLGTELPQIIKDNPTIIDLNTDQITKFEKLSEIEKALTVYTSLIKDKLKFEGVQFFGITPEDADKLKATIDDVNKTTEEKVNALVNIQFKGKEKLKKLREELTQEQDALLREQSSNIDTTYTEKRINDITNEITTLEDGIKVLQTTIKSGDFDVYRELFPNRTYLDVGVGLETITKRLVELQSQSFVTSKSMKNALKEVYDETFPNKPDGFQAWYEKTIKDKELLNDLSQKAKELAKSEVDELEKIISSTAKAENEVRGYTFQIQELGKEFKVTTSDIDTFFKSVEKDIPNLGGKFDFNKLTTEYRNYIDNTFVLFPKQVKEGNLEATLSNEEFLQKNTKLINEFLIKNGVSAELLAKLSTDQIKKLNKLFLDEAIKTDEQNLKERRDAYLNFYSSLASQITTIFGNITQQITDGNVSALENSKEKALQDFDDQTQAYEDMISTMSNADKAKQDKDRARAKERQKIEDEYNEKIREAEYQGEVRKWEYSLAEAGTQAILSVLKASPNVFAMTAAGILGTLSVAAIASNPPRRLATGGLVLGAGSGTSDSIPAMLSNGESVINAKSTKMFLPLLDQINQAGGGAPLLKSTPMFATGGVVQQTNIDTSRLENLILRMVDRPIKTYVVSSDITNTQNKDTRIKQRTTF